jgi:hypothetical protein
VSVSTSAQLQSAVPNLQSNQTIVLQPGTYQLSSPLYIGLNRPVSNVTIRGATGNFRDVVVPGFGMDDSRVGYGISVYNAQDVTLPTDPSVTATTMPLTSRGKPGPTVST